jgi:AcrR family transcriptional regulator
MTALQERKRQAAVDHLVAAALSALMEHGLDVTVEEIASSAGVSRRTVFRHFASRDELLATALRAWTLEFDESLPHYTGPDNWPAWLSQLCAALHLAFMTFRPVFWGLMARPDTSGPLAVVTEEIVRTRRDRAHAVADTLWQAQGHAASPSQDFRGTVIAHLSPFFTMAISTDAGGDHTLAASLAEAAILAVINKQAPPKSEPK